MEESVDMSTVLSWNQLQWFLAKKKLTSHDLEPEIPAPALNYNQTSSSTLARYVDDFKRDACLKELPFLIDMGLRNDSVLFDYGCGLGRLAYAASKYLSKAGRYIGYEPNSEALSFLKGAYGEKENFQFYGDELPLDEDYVAVQSGQSRQGGKKSIDILPQAYVGRIVDFQYSSSVMTHMWLDSISRLLENLNSIVKPGGFCVNTWLIIDDFARYTLDCNMADRRLPYVVNKAFTYSTTNPLVCTAYELSDVNAAYKNAGQQIQKIMWGSWSGRGNNVHYQDIVISRPRT
jgi:SAM-dependent methyltransferase